MIDTGILLEFIRGSSSGKAIGQMIFENDYISSIFVSPTTLIEIFYLIMRKDSQKFAETVLEKCFNQITANYISITLC